MSKISISRIVPYQGTFLGNPIHMSIEIESMFNATIVFTLFGMPYSFVISSWQGRGFRKFIEHFHSVAMSRNAIKFGVMIEKDDGTKDFLGNLDDVTQNADGTYTMGPNSKVMTQDQKINMIQQGCEDIMACLNLIGQVHQRSILEYCIWYRENHNKDTTYGSFITMMTCHAVTHSNFMAPGITWQLVEFIT